ncbi:MAG: hypothetical protein Q8O33_00175 [Pseudomonadota bacterium]|nr:hypothetical protein [Pseudomonadota bacterium]
MRHKAKRKMLLIGMAVAAGFPASTFAQGNGKIERHGHHYSGSGRGAPVSDLADLIQEAPEMQIADEGRGAASTLLGKLKDMAANLSSRVETIPANNQAWELGLSQSEPAQSGLTDHPKVAAGKPVGVALRLKF